MLNIKDKCLLFVVGVIDRVLDLDSHQDERVPLVGKLEPEGRIFRDIQICVEPDAGVDTLRADLNRVSIHFCGGAGDRAELQTIIADQTQVGLRNRKALA